ncbi:SMI1/KNR4 family protein [Amycolatopsis sp. H20-H5]|uniref:SMI1/KNR4 family protein n=1 Tax=Amycolatopsis sp. H20-H5 TaxID=3046309 RepID=UPI002DB9681B|nr:SMI1/KNR4 family protein [Amycolatopsis sp. H20-H5]MEC3975388.1 SMI1/KNR4 family protein [Amycolatopsis sp. H20-H5]
MPTTAELAAKLKLLTDADENLRVFGAEDHDYLSHPVSPEVLDDVEKSLGVELPRAYREFLAHVGYGAGPGYGLLDPGALASAGGRRDPAGEFPFTGSGGQADPRSPGCVIIGERGHERHAALVTTGPLAGTVWDVEDDAWRPRQQTFDAWYDEWLTRSLARTGA